MCTSMHLFVGHALVVHIPAPGVDKHTIVSVVYICIYMYLIQYSIIKLYFDIHSMCTWSMMNRLIL